jgi:hypothetical protein
MMEERRHANRSILKRMSWSGIPSGFQKELAPPESIRSIQLQEMFGDSPHSGQGNDPGPLQPEVLSPFVIAWVEQLNNFAGFKIDRRKITSLQAIANKTRKREIVLVGQSPVFPGKDVIYLVRQEGVFFMKQAVFAAMVGALAHYVPNSNGNPLAHDFKPLMARSLALALTNCISISACSNWSNSCCSSSER